MSGIALPTGGDYSTYDVDLTALWTNVAYDVGDAAAQWDAGKLPYLHLMFHPGEQGAYPMIEQIADGSWNAMISRWLERVKAYELTGRRCVIVPLPEMNGNWTSYGVDMDNPNPQAFIDVYRRIHATARSFGIKSDFCWAPNNTGVGRLADWWPGGDVVDVVGMSCYNGGGIFPDAEWESPEQVIAPYVDEVRVFTDLPFVVTQVGCGMGDDRAPRWLDDLVALQVDGVIDDYIWFNIDQFAWADGVQDFNRRVSEGFAFCGD